MTRTQGITNNDAYKTVARSFDKMVIELLIVFGIIILVTLLYILIRFNWAQFLAILASILFTVILTIAIVNITRVWITLDMALALLGVIVYVVIEGIVINSKMKYGKQQYNNKTFNPIYDEFLIYKKSLKEYKKFKKYYYKNKLNELILSEPEYSNKEFIKQQKIIIKEFKKLDKIESKKLKLLYINYKDKYKDQENNYLIKVKKNIFKDSFKRAVIISTIFTLIIILLTGFGGIQLGFGLVLLIGLNISIFSSVFVSTFIWTVFEKYRIFNGVKINKYLKNHVLSLDEEDIIGVNC